MGSSIRFPWSALLALFLLQSGCVSTATVEEAMGRGIVYGTLGAKKVENEMGTAYQEHTRSVRGHVIALEGGAYVLHGLDGAAHRIPLDENTRIDRPAHVGDKIEAFLDGGGRAVLIRNIDHDHNHTF